jgi:NADPH2:quinone reductase|tara:strand:+ start:1468 stop:2451 length:984 start_codon:yes stop_codon:yes gene_type:complete
MRVVLCTKFGGPELLQVGEIDPPALGAKDIRVAAVAAGVNFLDTAMISGAYPVQPPLPFVLGGEAAGEVIEVGGAVERFKTGDRVMTLSVPGCFAEQVVVPETSAQPVPDGMDFESAAGFTIAYGTAYYALIKRSHLQADQVLLVLGATGGTGLAVVEVGRAAGADVIAVGSNDDKLQQAAKQGAAHLINYEREQIAESVMKITDGRGADVIFDGVGGEAFKQALGCIAGGGRLASVGGASGEILEISVLSLMAADCDLIGISCGAYAARDPGAFAEDFEQLASWYGEGKINPHISATFPLEQVAAALDMLIARKVIGKVVLTMGPE